MLIFSIILLLLSNAVNLRRESSILYSRISVLILINTIIILYLNLDINFFIKGIVLYGGLLSIKLYSYIFMMFALLLSVFILGITSVLPNYLVNNYSSTQVDNKNEFSNGMIKEINSSLNNIITNKMTDQFRIIEYPLIILFCLSGAAFLMSSSDIISIFLSLELQSYGLYLISSIYRNSESSISAGLTYFLLGGLSSCIILLGLSLLYINTGNTNLDNIYMINSISNAFASNLISDNIPLDNLWVYKHVYMQYTYMQLPLAIISVGLLFKIASAPFHFWSPDVYDAIPTIVTTFVAIIAKISILTLFLELILYTEDNLISFSWSNIIVLSSILSLLIGSILGLVQYRIKRLYAYSTISHIGFILLALSINNLEATRAFFFYIIQYSISNLNTFIILITIGYSLHIYINNDNTKLKDEKYSPIQFISQLKGYYHINPILSLSFIITLFSFAGVPPLIGFFGKQMVLSAAIDNGYIFTALIAILTSVVSAVYYLGLVKVVFFESSNYILNNKLFSYLTDIYHNIVNKTIKLNISHIQKHTTIEDSKELYSNEKGALFNKFLSEKIDSSSVTVSGFLSFSISLMTLFILSFILFDQELIRLIYIII